MKLKPKRKILYRRSSGGFTLIEVLVALFIATILIGSTMALIGVSMRNSDHAQKLRSAIPVLDAAAQEIIRDPKKALKSPLVLEDFPGEPSVTVEAHLVEDPTVSVKLYRVTFYYGGEALVTSVIVSETTEIQ
jgi:prepilin-type N-terminal cleavage/methylation domain-containing protein